MHMKLTILALILGLFGGAVFAQPATPPAPAAPEAAPAPPPDPILIKVGTIEIRQSAVDALLARLPAYQRSSSRDRALAYLTGDALRKEFIRVNNLQVPDDEYAAKVAEYREKFERQVEEMKQRFEREMVSMRGEMALKKHIDQATTDELVKKFVADNPEYFDGTKVEVSHILIKCSLFDSTEVQAAARKRLVDIVRKIRNRELTFVEAATEFSGCTSKAKGGDLGTIEFGAPMDRFFTMQAFKTEEGQMSGIFRTKDGWHVLLVTKIEAGDRTAKPWKSPRGQEMSPEDLAKGTIVAMIDNQVMLGAMDTVPVVNNLPQVQPAVPAPRPPAPRPAPAD